MEPASQNLPAAKANDKADMTVVQLHSHLFENPEELSSVLKTFWDDDKFSVEMQNDMYIIHVSSPPAENKNTKSGGAHE
ncbi:hypothetical protein F4776DRAFT_612285 [Hypoxylon sp. NC0597]|nr:hypothetical protein F4776DRAFT_612285 [Hypoxylon sp. NC0597]